MKHFWEYLKERFPLQINGLLILSYFAANDLLAQATDTPNELIKITWHFVAGAITLLLMFFHLRVIDEHKDYKQDCIVHPNRVLSRGLITLKQLRFAGFIAIFLELSLSFLLGLPALGMCLVLLSLAWLIYKEFYIGGFLQKHLIVSAFLHLLIMPVYSLFIFTIATRRSPGDAPNTFLLYAWVSYGVGFAYELARKTRAPQDERPGLITYSAAIGPYKAAYGALAALIFSGTLSSLVGVFMNFGSWYHIGVGTLLIFSTFSVFRFRFQTNTTTAAHLSIYAGLCIFAFDWLLAAELIRTFGLGWR